MRVEVSRDGCLNPNKDESLKAFIYSGGWSKWVTVSKAVHLTFSLDKLFGSGFNKMSVSVFPRTCLYDNPHSGRDLDH